MEDEEKKSEKMHEAMIVIIILGLLIVLGPATLSFFHDTITLLIGPTDGYEVSAITGIKTAIGMLIGLSFPLSFFFLIGIVYCVERTKVIRLKEKEIYDLKVETSYEMVDKGDPNLTNRWQHVLIHVESQNQNDWKQAILDADIILDEILTKMGYRGESVGEKLKRVEPADFKSLNEAWEAHKIRNRVAHDGSEFKLGQYEAKQTINLYKKVFEEFYYI